jgi:hypothetical protein
MEPAKKRYLLAWGGVGLVLPAFLLLIARFALFGDRAARIAAALLAPLIFVVLGLGPMVTDGGGDSNTLFRGKIIFTSAILLCAGLFAGFGLVSWPIVRRLHNWNDKAFDG